MRGGAQVAVAGPCRIIIDAYLQREAWQYYSDRANVQSCQSQARARTRSRIPLRRISIQPDRLTMCGQKKKKKYNAKIIYIWTEKTSRNYINFQCRSDFHSVGAPRARVHRWVYRFVLNRNTTHVRRPRRARTTAEAAPNARATPVSRITVVDFTRSLRLQLQLFAIAKSSPEKTPIQMSFYLFFIIAYTNFTSTVNKGT